MSGSNRPVLPSGREDQQRLLSEQTSRPSFETLGESSAGRPQAVTDRAIVPMTTPHSSKSGSHPS